MNNTPICIPLAHSGSIYNLDVLMWVWSQHPIWALYIIKIKTLREIFLTHLVLLIALTQEQCLALTKLSQGSQTTMEISYKN